MNNNEIWQAVLAELELSISKANFITWFKNTGIISFQEGHVILCVNSTFTQAWLEKKYQQVIIKSLERVTAKPVKKMEYRVDNIKNIVENNTAPAETAVQFPVPTYSSPTTETIYFTQKTPAQSQSGGFTINPKLTFDSYVVGRGSELAFAAAQAVTARPGEAYNPLFIYGGVGLGKTHLLQAIANSLIKSKPDVQIMYVSAEKFSNDFIDSIRTGKGNEFQNRYRQIDALLIDDIQFIAGKDRTQESFFHTFNELHQQNKQVVLTSDRPPKAIPTLEDRLRSRFEWGMIADVSAPDYETRIAILEKKSLEKNFPLPPEVIQVVASIVQNNIRELEGALNKIIAYHQLKALSPSKESVKSLLSTAEMVAARRSFTSSQLIQTVGEYFGISDQDVMGKSREKKLSFPRQIIMFMMREELKMSYPSIGDELGGRDHTTAMHAHTKIASELENDLKLKQDLEALKQRLYTPTS